MYRSKMTDFEYELEDIGERLGAKEKRAGKEQIFSPSDLEQSFFQSVIVLELELVLGFRRELMRFSVIILMEIPETGSVSRAGALPAKKRLLAAEEWARSGRSPMNQNE
jgi:hypothetical protein